MFWVTNLAKGVEFTPTTDRIHFMEESRVTKRKVGGKQIIDGEEKGRKRCNPSVFMNTYFETVEFFHPCKTQEVHIKSYLTKRLRVGETLNDFIIY